MLIDGNRSGKLFTVVFYQTIGLIIYMLIGVIIKVKGYFTKQVNLFLGWFLTNIALPSAILRSFQMEYTAQIKKLMLTSLLYSIVFIIGTLGLSYLFCVIFKRKYVERRMWVCCFTFSSILFIGMPIVEALYGVAFISGMPTSALNAVFAEEYAQKGEKVSQYITVSTIISMFTLPIIMLFL